ncbi:MAG: S58 family peptidase [Luteitalea sp.]|nr:S58 family peptidase [Luteitalea sp.]
MSRYARVLLMLVLLGATFVVEAQEPRPRARDLGIRPGVFETGRLNTITDVEGVRVGHATLIRGERVRTGVTAILPHGGNLFQDKVAGAVFVGNAFGKLAGALQVAELGTIETPIVLTSTLSVGTASEAVVEWTLQQSGNHDVRSVNPLVGETNDGRLNDIRGRHVGGADVLHAIEEASAGAVAEGAVGAGTGTSAFGWKGGIGTASRVLPRDYGGFTVGVLVQTNYGGFLTIDGVPVWRTLGQPPFPVAGAPDGDRRSDDGSCMIVASTDAPLDAAALERLAARAIYALARTGSSYTNGSGDFAIAFSTARDARWRHGDRGARPRALLPSDALSPLFQAVIEATEEAVYNSLFAATTTTGNGHTVEALPIDELRRLLQSK